ncbi:MAG: polymer-forming cytoskeletal protein [bacterium]|nr:polymer-forming cytoskeletal protein [bacterium]
MDILRKDPLTQPGGALQAPQSPSPLSQHRTEQPYTTLGKDTEFQGTLRFKEGLRIEGRFNGDIASEGHLIVGKTGEVTAEISVGSIIVEGKVNGNIIATDLVELRSTAEMRGDITAAKMKIEEGVIFVGKADVQPGNQNNPKAKKAFDSKKDEKK